MIKKLNCLSGSVGRLYLTQSVYTLATTVNNCIFTINQLIDKVEELEAENKELLDIVKANNWREEEK